MWDILGFKESPYSCTPLTVCQNDVDLLVGRSDDSVRLCTILESSKQGIAIISGNPGVGKTSFLNVQQHLLETNQSICGPNIIACRYLSPVNPSDTNRDIAFRILHNLYNSIIDFGVSQNIKPSKEISNVGKWLANKGSVGYEFGISIAGFGGNIGRQVELPSIQDISFEGITDVIKCLVSEVVNHYKRPGIILVLDNIENLEERQLYDLLITFRDTLFSISCLWWVLIGQSGLGSFIQSLDPRVFQRVSGTAIELLPISKEEFHLAIEQRVIRFHSTGNGKAPLTKEVHDFLYDSAKGQIRFVFKYSSDICTRWVSNIRSLMIEKLKKEGEPLNRQLLDKVIGEHLIAKQIETSQAFLILKEIVAEEFANLNLNAKEISVLKKIGDLDKVRSKDHDAFSIKSMQQFSSHFLTKLHNQSLLSREQEGRAVLYSLSGLSLIAHGFELL